MSSACGVPAAWGASLHLPGQRKPDEPGGAREGVTLAGTVWSSLLAEKAGEGHEATDTCGAACIVAVTLWRHPHVPALPRGMADGARDSQRISLGGLWFDVLGAPARQR